MLIVFIYAVLGVVLFTYLGHEHSYHYTDSRNFNHIGNAFMLLFKVLM